MTTATATYDAATASVALTLTPTPAVTYAWLGTAHASESTRTEAGQDVRVNRLTDPAARGSVWTASRWFGAGAPAGTYTFVTGATDGPLPGVTSYRRKTWTSPTAPTDTTDTGLDVRPWCPVVAGDVVTMSGYLRHSSQTAKPVEARIFWRDAAGAVMTAASVRSPAPTVAPKGTWTRVEVTGTAPAGAVSLWVTLDVKTKQADTGLWANGDTLDGTAVLVELAPGPARPYFDGDTADIGAETVLGLTRADANGSGVAVRTLDGLLPAAPGAQVVVRDYEPAQGQVVYTVAATDTAGTRADAQVSVDVDLGGPRLAAVVSPAMLALPELVTGYDGARTPTTTLHPVIGRPDPVPVLGHLSRRAGKLDVLCRDYTAARDVVAVYGVAQVVLFRQDDYPGLDLYHVAAGPVTESPAGTAGRWLVTIPYAEVRRPADALRGALGWTWDALAAAVDTWDQLVQRYGTWNDTEVGPTP